MFSFCRHVTTGTLKLQRYLSSTKSILKTESAKVERHNLVPFRLELESVYREDHYPSRERREIMAEHMDLPINTISRWFIRRRAADKEARSIQGQDTSEFRGYERATDEQNKILWDQFARNLYPSESEIALLTKRLGISRTKALRRLSDMRYMARQGSVPTDISLTITPAKRSTLPLDKLAILEEHFLRDPYPKRTGTFDALVQKVKLSPSRVGWWFLEKRRRQRENPVRPLTKVMDEVQNQPPSLH